MSVSHQMADEASIAPMVQFIQGRGMSVNLNSYKCVLDIFNGLSESMFEEIAVSCSINAGIQGGYLPRDSDDILPCLERYRVGGRAWGLSKSDLQSINRVISILKQKKPQLFMHKMLDIVMEMENEHLEYNLTTIVDMKVGEIDMDDEHVKGFIDAMAQIASLMSPPQPVQTEEEEGSDEDSSHSAENIPIPDL